MTEPSSQPGGTVDDKTQPTIDGATALRLLREVVTERPDYVYEAPASAKRRCVYVADGAPSCLIGHALVRAGWPVDVVAELDDFDDSGAGLLAQRFSAREITSDAARIFAEAQVVQDDQEVPWSEALAAAEERAVQLGVSA